MKATNKQSQSSGYDKHAIKFAVGLGVAVFAVYTLTLYPGLPGGDSGELIAVSRTLGIAHPPGYPLFTLLGYLFSYIPFGTIAWRVNLLSAVCDAASVSLLFLLVSRLTKSLSAGIIAASLFAFSPSVWNVAVSAEVFGLNNLFVSALLLIALNYHEDRRSKWLYLGSFVLGLGLTNQHTLVFYGLPLVFWALVINRNKMLNIKAWGIAFLAFVAGLLPYLYLPLAMMHHPLISWGNLNSWTGFVTHILRSDYGTFALLSNEVSRDFFSHFAFYFENLVKDMFYLGLPLAAFGIFISIRGKQAKTFLWLTLFSYATYIVFFNLLINFPLDDLHAKETISRFWQQPNFILCIWVGLGTAPLLTWLSKKLSPIAVFGASFTIAMMLMGIQYKTQDRHQVRSFERFGKKIIEKLPLNSILLTRGDIYANCIRYVQVVENFRKDVALIDEEIFQAEWMKTLIQVHFPNIKVPGKYYRPNDPDGFNLKTFFDSNQDVAIFYTFLPKTPDASWERDYKSVPLGYLNRVVPKNAVFDWKESLLTARTTFIGQDPYDLSDFPDGTWEKDVWLTYWSWSDNQARYLFEHGVAKQNIEIMKAAATFIEDVLTAAHTAAPPLTYKNLGTIYYKLISLNDRSAVSGLVAAWGKYFQVARLDDPDLPEMKNIVSYYNSH